MKMKPIACASILLVSIVSASFALKCYECSGSEVSDCAKGVKSAGVEVNCEAPDYDSPVHIPANAAGSNEETTTEVDEATSESHYEKMKRLGCFQPMKLYPACVTYSMQPYNGIEGQKMIYRSCMLTAEDFCKGHTQFNKDQMCRSCNSTDFCM